MPLKVCFDIHTPFQRESRQDTLLSYTPGAPGLTYIHRGHLHGKKSIDVDSPVPVQNPVYDRPLAHLQGAKEAEPGGKDAWGCVIAAYADRARSSLHVPGHASPCVHPVRGVRQVRRE